MKKLSLLFLVILFTKIADAQWQTNGPYSHDNNGDVTCLAVSGNSIFAGTDDSEIYVSTNNGGSWTHLDSGIIDFNITALIANGSNLYASSEGSGGIFLSTDNGSFWTRANDIFNPVEANAFLFSGSNIFAGGGDEIFIANDSGVNWTAVDSGIPMGAMVTSLALSGSTIFAGTYGNGLFISNNNGVTWTETNIGLTNSYINALAVNGSDVYAGTDGAGVFISNDNGVSWSQISTGLTQNALYISSFAISGSYIFAGTYGEDVFLSTNNGNSWTSVSDGLGISTGTVFALAINNGYIFVGAEGGGVYQEAIADINTSTGIYDLNNSNNNHFSLYPNPANNSFELETNGNEQKQMQVCDVTGKLLLTQTIQNPKTTVDASNLAAGMYFVSLKSADGVSKEKLVIGK